MTRRLVFSLLALLAGCRREPAGDEASISRALAEKGAMEVVAEAAKAEYDPPADGRLAERQVRMYVEVQRRARRIRAVAAGRARAEAAAADQRAAQDLGYNPREYQWVEERVLEARIAQAGRDLAGRLAPGRVRYLEALEEQKRTATGADRAAIERRIARFREGVRAAAPAMTPAVRHNVALLARYRQELAAALAPAGTEERTEPAR